MFLERATVAVAAAAAAVMLAHAQDYPARPVRIVAPFVSGSPGDLMARSIAPGLAPLLGQQVIVENRPGAATIIGMQAVAKAAPDGHTLVFASSTSLALNVSAYKNLPYDPVKDFAPVALCFTTPLYLVVHSSLPANSVHELIALARSRPGQLMFGSGGTGTSNHLAGELFKSLAGVDMQHVPYKSAGPAMADVIAGHVDLIFGAWGLAEARAGKVRVLAVTSARRSALAPDIPTVQEAGLPGFEATIWFGMLAPAHTPAAIVRRLSDDIHKVLGEAQTRERLSTVDITPSTPEEFASFIQREIPKWRRVFAAARIEPE